jgi:hypothetical protein
MIYDPKGLRHIETTVISIQVAQNRLSGIVSPLDTLSEKAVYSQFPIVDMELLCVTKQQENMSFL